MKKIEGITQELIGLLAKATAEVEFTKGRSNALLKKWKFVLTTPGEQTINLQGNFIYGVDSTAPGTLVSVQFSRKDSGVDYFDIVKGLGYLHPFDKLHVSWTAQAGETLTLLIGNLAPGLIGILDNRSQVSLTGGLNNILAELQGETAPQGYAVVDMDAQPHVIVGVNASRKSVILTADPLNTVRVYLGYDSDVTTNKWFTFLDAGDSYIIDDYRGLIYGYPTSITAGNRIGYGEV